MFGVTKSQLSGSAPPPICFKKSRAALISLIDAADRTIFAMDIPSVDIQVRGGFMDAKKKYVRFKSVWSETPHSSSVKARYGVPFVGLNPDSYSASPNR